MNDNPYGPSVTYYFESGAHNLNLDKIGVENQYKLNESL